MEPPNATVPLEESLADLVVDLFDQFGPCNPKPAGIYVRFNLVAENTTYVKAKAEIEALLTLHGVHPISLSITPGPEVRAKYNRNIRFALMKDRVA